VTPDPIPRESGDLAATTVLVLFVVFVVLVCAAGYLGHAMAS
jgi:hypothetical protein